MPKGHREGILTKYSMALLDKVMMVIYHLYDLDIFKRVFVDFLPKKSNVLPG